MELYKIFKQFSLYLVIVLLVLSFSASANAAKKVSSRFHLAYLKEIGGAMHVIYDGKDMGKGQDILLSKNDIVIRNEEHIFYNGKEIGSGLNVELSSPNVAYKRLSDGHLIYHGKDYGKVVDFKISGKHLIYTKMNGLSFLTFYDQKELGDSVGYGIFGDHIALVKDVYDPKTLIPVSRIFYDGKDMGKGEGDPVINDKHIAYWRQVKDKYHVIFDGKDLGVGNKPLIPGFFGLDIQLADQHIVFLRRTDTFVTHVIYDGKDIGEGSDPKIAGRHIAFLRGNDFMKKHLIYDKKDMGIVSYENDFSLTPSHFAYNRVVKYKTHIILDGKDIGEGSDPVLEEY